jgi:hypothetical protein
VTASNIYGESPYSLMGDGASIWVNPDAPVQLSNNAQVTNAANIGLQWLTSPSDGGTAVLDYRIFYSLVKQPDGNGDYTFVNSEFTLLTDGISSTSYTTSQTLISGALYSFKVQARNVVGYSTDSNLVSIYAASVPNAPTNV